jgi:hypothetical protein
MLFLVPVATFVGRLIYASFCPLAYVVKDDTSRRSHKCAVSIVPTLDKYVNLFYGM